MHNHSNKHRLNTTDLAVLQLFSALKGRSMADRHRRNRISQDNQERLIRACHCFKCFSGSSKALINRSRFSRLFLFLLCLINEIYMHDSCRGILQREKSYND